MTVNDSPKYFTSDCQRVELKRLLKEVKKQLKAELLKSNLAINGFESNIITSQTGNGGERYWFVCCMCKKPCGCLYKHPVSELVACRSCLHLKYKKNLRSSSGRSAFL